MKFVTVYHEGESVGFLNFCQMQYLIHYIGLKLSRTNIAVRLYGER
jgi:hypothetical protein